MRTRLARIAQRLDLRVDQLREAATHRDRARGPARRATRASTLRRCRGRRRNDGRPGRTPAGSSSSVATEYQCGIHRLSQNASYGENCPPFMQLEQQDVEVLLLQRALDAVRVRVARSPGSGDATSPGRPRTGRPNGARPTSRESPRRSGTGAAGTRPAGAGTAAAPPPARTRASRGRSGSFRMWRRNWPKADGERLAQLDRRPPVAPLDTACACGLRVT